MDNAVQQAAAGFLKPRQVDIAALVKRILTEYRITMMTIIINRVFTIGIMRPQIIRQKLKLGFCGPSLDTFFVMIMMAQPLTDEEIVNLAAYLEDAKYVVE